MIKSALYLIPLLFMELAFSDVIAHTEIKAQIHKTSENEAILGITLTPESHWHTYWSNPGDAGLALSISLDDQNLTVTAQDFPTPKRYDIRGVIAYGYDDAKTFLFTITGNLPKKISGEASWLTCDETACVPGSKAFILDLPETEAFPQWFLSAKKSQPRPLRTPLTAQQQGNVWTFSFPALRTDLKGWSVFPADNNFSEIKGETKISDSLSFSFKLLGNLPKNTRFLVTNEELAYWLSL